jgi:hypothetical protein
MIGLKKAKTDGNREELKSESFRMRLNNSDRMRPTSYDEKGDNEEEEEEENDDEDNDDLQNSSKPVYTETDEHAKVDVSDKLLRLRNLCGDFVNNPKVQLFIVVLITINAVMMGIGTFKFPENIATGLSWADNIFLSIFTIELGLQLIALGVHFFLDGWLIFDFVIIFVSWTFDSISFVRAFRIFRALRLVTRVKTMKNLVLVLFSVLPNMGAIVFLLLMVSYIFAVMFTQLFKDIQEYNGLSNDTSHPDYYGRLDLTLFTLFQLMTLDGWSEIARETIDVYKCK